MNGSLAIERECIGLDPLTQHRTRKRRKKILFMAEGITMTHFARPASLAQSLDPAEWDVCFWTPRRYHRLLQQEFSQLGDLRTIDPQAFLESLARGSTLYTESALRQYVADDLEIFKTVRPDFVFGDFRLSLCISAPLSGVPYGSIFNAHWSPFRNQPAIVPELPITRWISPSLLNPLFALLKPAVHALHARPVNKVRKAFGLPFISHDLREIYMAGDLVLYPDVPELVPLNGAPENHHFIGFCPWSPPASRPEWWDEVMDSPQPKIFVSLGSSGAIKALPAVLKAASQLPVKVMLATSAREIGSTGPNVYVAELLPYEETARHSALVVSHGGTGGLYFTLAAGTPMLAIPNNVDNHLSTRLLEQNGAGLSVRVENASPKRLLHAMQRMLAEPSFKASAQRLALAVKRHETQTIFPQILRNWFARADRRRIPT